jgi:hypothetical protein
MYVYLQREYRIKKEQNDKISNTNRRENQNCLYCKKNVESVIKRVDRWIDEVLQPYQGSINGYIEPLFSIITGTKSVHEHSTKKRFITELLKFRISMPNDFRFNGTKFSYKAFFSSVDL